MKITKNLKFKLRNLLLTCGSVETDKATLLYEGELEVGTEVFVENENGEIVPAEDGEYVDGDKTYVVAEGKVAEIKEKEEETTETETIETEEEPEADPADEPETAEEESEADRIARLEGAVEELREGIETLTNAIAALAERVGKVEEKLAALDEPAAEPAEQGEETEEKFTSKLNYLRKNKK